MRRDRRSFFQTIAALFALPATTTLSAAKTGPYTVTVSTGPAYEKLPLVSASLRELIESSFRLLGVIAAGEKPLQCDMEAAKFALATLDPIVQAFPIDQPLRFTPRGLHTLRYALALELGPEYRGICYPLPDPPPIAAEYFDPVLLVDRERWPRRVS